MKNIKELGLELIELEGDLLLVDKNSKIEKGDLFEFDTLICIYDGTYHLGAGREHKIIASTKPLEGLPLLVIEDEVEKMADSDTEGYFETDYQKIFVEGFIRGYNKAKETYKFTEEDLIKAIKMSKITQKYKYGEGRVFVNSDESIIQSLTKKELWIEVEEWSLAENVEAKNQNVPKITNNQIKGIYK